MGVKYWAKWYPTGTPRYEVFKVYAINGETKMFSFKHVKLNKFIHYSFKDLKSAMGVKQFRPFLLEFNTILGYLNGKDF